MATATSERPITDRSGYSVRDEDLVFLRISAESFAAYRTGTRPLGVTATAWQELIEALEIALKHDGIQDADIRLQGSSAFFFSGRHKRMQYTPEDLTISFMELRGRRPSRYELDQILRHIENVWPGPVRPLQRPFDALFRLRITRYPSDLDFQISSKQLVKRVTAQLQELGLAINDRLLKDERYGFIRKPHIVEAAPSLTSWAIRQADVLDRPVTVAVFPADGPPKVRGQSSHFKRTDWQIPMGADVRHEI
jgi:hypothetical protein